MKPMSAETIADILNEEVRRCGYDMRGVIQKDFAGGVREFCIAGTNEVLFATRNLGNGNAVLLKPEYRLN